MNKHWLLQCNLINQNQVELVRRAALACGDHVQSVSLTPITGEMEYIDGPPPADVIPYGSNALIQNGIALGWGGVFYNDQFCVAAWNRNRRDMVNSQPLIVRARDVPHLALRDGPYFVRPNADFKAIPGSVVSRAKLIDWMAGAGDDPLMFNRDTLVALSRPVSIMREWRWFIVDGRVIDGTLYMDQGWRCSIYEADPDIRAEAQALADVWLPHPTCVMDVALVEDGNDLHVRVLEFNNLNTCGFYKHDIAKIVTAISELA